MRTALFSMRFLLGGNRAVLVFFLILFSLIPDGPVQAQHYFLNPSSKISNPREIPRNQLGDEFFGQIFSIIQRNFYQQRPSVVLIVGPEASGKTTFDRWMKEGLSARYGTFFSKNSIRLRQLAGDEHWFLGYARRPKNRKETPDKFTIQGLTGVRALLGTRKGEEFFVPFFYQTNRRRQRIVNDLEGYVDEKGWVKEGELAGKIQHYIDQILAVGGKKIEFEGVTLIQLFDEEGNTVLKDPHLAQEIGVIVERVQREHPEGHYVDKKDIFLDISQDPVTGFMKGDIVERINPRNTVFLFEYLLGASDSIFSLEERKHLYDLIIYLDNPAYIRENRARARYRRGGRHQFVTEEEFMKQFRDRLTTEAGRWVEPTKEYADLIVKNYSDIETIPDLKSFRSLPKPIQNFFLTEVIYGEQSNRYWGNISEDQKRRIVASLQSTDLSDGDISLQERSRIALEVSQLFGISPAPAIARLIRDFVGDWDDLEEHPRMVGLDVDGTLISKINDSMEPELAEGIQALREEGVNVFLISGASLGRIERNIIAVLQTKDEKGIRVYSSGTAFGSVYHPKWQREELYSITFQQLTDGAITVPILSDEEVVWLTGQIKEIVGAPYADSVRSSPVDRPSGVAATIGNLEIAIPLAQKVTEIIRTSNINERLANNPLLAEKGVQLRVLLSKTGQLDVVLVTKALGMEHAVARIEQETSGVVKAEHVIVIDDSLVQIHGVTLNGEGLINADIHGQHPRGLNVGGVEANELTPDNVITHSDRGPMAVKAFFRALLDEIRMKKTEVLLPVRGWEASQLSVAL